MSKKRKNEITIRSSAAEYLTFIASTGDNPQSVEMRYEDENIWLTQKMMAELYDVSIPAVNQHIQKIFEDNERAVQFRKWAKLPPKLPVSTRKRNLKNTASCKTDCLKAISTDSPRWKSQ